MSSSSFEEAVQFSLERLNMKDLGPREEQLQSIKAVYDGLNVFVCLPTRFGLLPGHFFHDVLQAGQSWDFQS